MMNKPPVRDAMDRAEIGQADWDDQVALRDEVERLRAIEAQYQTARERLADALANWDGPLGERTARAVVADIAER